jgi:hypothetical protein
MLFLICVNFTSYSMRTNPGGGLAPEEVVGRDALIADLWDKLERHSVMMTAERRMGKTSVLRKMLAQQPPGVTAFYWDLENIRSPEALVREIFNKVNEDLGNSQKWQGKVQQLLKNWGLGGEKIAGVSLPKPDLTWQQHLQGMVRDLSSQVEDRERWLFLFDELPLAIDNIRQDKGASIAMEVLDTLRSIRQDYPQIRMVYTGSIGLHHVVAELKAQGYRNAPTNDLPPIEVEPLNQSDALKLARDLLIGEGLVIDDLEQVSKAIVSTVDAIPFYIHHTVSKLKALATPVTAIQVKATIQACIQQYNIWDMGYYEERINSYYGAKVKLALLALDELAPESALTIGDWWNRVSIQTPDLDKEAFRSTLNLLEQDHYICRNDEGAYRFRFSLVQRYWHQQRGN